MKFVRQIMTKAVIAKGKKKTEAVETLRPPNEPDSILGCWVINHTYQAKKQGNYVEVVGKYDINVWYAHHDQSKTSVFSETVPYRDKVKVHYRDSSHPSVEEIKVRVIQHPSCEEAIITSDGECFQVTVEKEICVEIIGETLLSIQVHPHEFEEEWKYEESTSSSSDFLMQSESSSH
ncbi:outer spore coat protein CotE [Paenisporosarcina cavernae]|uniref:Outer spore coat protein CotE n=1 Tax=Paenisporosarcina cavernae TaxID=2320858 RepID=A0A385YV03_9BACL|nr:outer spore coat protein CotE [Paenisporosarcina cavernae]AYC29313.1 outer spore coat protein CotE [Paenisporosarcina cavernae]